MGLDMYLSARKFMAPEYFSPKEFEKVRMALGLEINKMADMPSIIVEVSAAYWRKSNQIHKWFVDNVQDGKDDCRDYPVNHATLKKLQELCVSIAKNKAMAETALPTQEGFFFGSLEYDEHYYSDIEYTINQIQNVLENYKEEDNWSLSYHSSW
jgi:hypothetical protein